MTNKDKTDIELGPQGTQVFSAADVNKMIAAQIINVQSDTASVPALFGISESVNGRQFKFPNNKFSIGRSLTSDLILDDASVSSDHAQIIKIDDYWKILNLLSSNGTFVNGKKVVEQKIVPGDRLAFAEVEFVFTLVEEEKPIVPVKKSYALVYSALAMALAFAILFYFLFQVV